MPLKKANKPQKRAREKELQEQHKRKQLTKCQ